MFRSSLQPLHKPLKGSVLSAFAVLSFAALIIGLDSTILNGAVLSLPGQLDAEGSTLQWITRAKAIAGLTGTAAKGIGLGPLAGSLLFMVSIGGRSL
jgi:hypothetical protein